MLGAGPTRRAPTVVLGGEAVLRDALRDVARRLMDAVDPELPRHVEAVLAAVPGIEGVDRVRVRWVGHALWAEAEVVSDCELRLDEAHTIAEDARHRLLHAVPRLTHVTVHASPCNHAGTDHHALTAHHA